MFSWLAFWTAIGLMLGVLMLIALVVGIIALVDHVWGRGWVALGIIVALAVLAYGTFVGFAASW